MYQDETNIEEIKEEENPSLEDNQPLETSDKNIASFNNVDIKQKNEKDYRDIVEELRVSIYNQTLKAQKRSRLGSWILTLGAIAGVILFFCKDTQPQIAGLFIGLAIACLSIGIITVIVISILNRRTNHIDTKKEYIYPATVAMNRFIFESEDFEQVTEDCEEKVDMEDVLADKVYANAVDSVSRNFVHGLYKGKIFYVGEIGLFNGPATSRRRQPIFIGKYLRIENKAHFTGNYIILSKGETEIDIPTLPEGYSVLLDEGKFLVYGKDGANYQKDVGKAFVEKIKDFKIEGVLLNIAVSVFADHISFYLSYDDPVTTLPFYEKLNESAIETYKENLYKALEALDYLSKE